MYAETTGGGGRALPWWLKLLTTTFASNLAAHAIQEENN